MGGESEHLEGGGSSGRTEGTSDLASDVVSTVGDASNTLLLVPSLSEHEESVCMALQTAVAPADTRVLGITLTQSPEQRLAAWRSHVGERPAAARMVTCEGLESGDLSVPVGTVSDPGDLTGLATAITTGVDDWQGPGRTVVCFRSLDPVLFYAELDAAFQFLHAITSHLDEAGARSHYHIDPTAHDDQVLSTVVSLFDAVVEVERDGSWTRHR